MSETLTPPQRMDWPSVPEIIWNGQPYLYFCGTGYLGLQNDPRVLQAASDATQLGLHACTTRAGWGTTPYHTYVEDQLRDFTGFAEALYLPTGFGAVRAALQMLKATSSLPDFQFILKSMHPAGREAARDLLPEYPIEIGLDLEDLDDLPDGATVLLMADGVLPISGKSPDFSRIPGLLNRGMKITLIVDDAHGFGVLGNGGRGTLDAHNLTSVISKNGSCPLKKHPSLRIYYCGTLSKAAGGYGGFVASSDGFDRSAVPLYTGTTPLPNPIAAATARALTILTSEPEHLANLRRNITCFSDGLRSIGLTPPPENIPVWSVSFSDMESAQAVWQSLAGQGILCQIFPAYSDATGPCIRVALFASHTKTHITRLIDALSKAPII